MTSKPGIRTDDDGELLCPRCGFEYTHLDFVHVSARREDGEFNEIEIDAVSGAVIPSPESGPIGTTVGTGRRHRISLRGSCEKCGGGWALVFTQHKGTTFVECDVQDQPNG